MAGESILIVDDTPVNLKLTQLVLAGQGYSVTTALSAEAALQELETFKPELILADVLLPGMDGLEMTRRIKSDVRKSDIKVVALTAFATNDDRERALAAGCDDYIPKPIETRTLGAKIREVLDRRTAAQKNPAPEPPSFPGLILTKPDFEELQLRYATEGARECQQLLNSLRADFKLQAAKQSAHQWIGSANLMNYPEIGDLAKRLEELLNGKPLDATAISDCLIDLEAAFYARCCALERSMPEHIGRSLNGKRIGLIGFTPEYAERTCGLLEKVGARPRLFDIGEAAECEALQTCEIALIHVRPETKNSAWLEIDAPLLSTLIITGKREDLLDVSPAIQRRSEDFLMDDWRPEELLMRLSRALSRRTKEPEGVTTISEKPSTGEDPRIGAGKVILADDDPLMLMLAARTLRNFGMTCFSTSDGRDALRLIREERPNVAVLDVNMPGADGFEVLSAIRTDALRVRVIMLTARRREEDILKGFGLGADDYISKPFNPLELAARVKRLLQ